MWSKIILNVLTLGVPPLLMDAVKQCRHRERFMSLDEVDVQQEGDSDFVIETWKCTKCWQIIRKVRDDMK